jgi:hypothetical protein
MELDYETRHIYARWKAYLCQLVWMWIIHSRLLNMPHDTDTVENNILCHLVNNRHNLCTCSFVFGSIKLRKEQLWIPLTTPCWSGNFHNSRLQHCPEAVLYQRYTTVVHAIYSTPNALRKRHMHIAMYAFVKITNHFTRSSFTNGAVISVGHSTQGRTFQFWLLKLVS